MLKLALAQLRDQPRRYVSVLLAITIGVTFLASALFVGSSATASLRNSLGATYSKADLVVAPAPDAGDPFTAMTEIAEAAGTNAEPGPLQDVDGVQDAHAHVVTPVGVQRPDDAEGQGTWGPDTDFALASTVPEDPSLLSGALVSGALPESGSTAQVALDERSAERMGLDVGSTTYLTAGTSAEAAGRKVTVTGLTEVSQDPNAIGALQVTVDPALADALKRDSAESMMAERPTGAEGAGGAAGADGAVEDLIGPAYAEHVLLRLESGADPQAVMAAIEQYLSGESIEATVATPDEQAQQQVQAMLGSNVFVLVLGSFAVIALLVTALVIANTFSVLVAQRSRDLALQRAIGASRRQVRGAVLTEAGIVGVLGGLLGVGVAAGIVSALIAIGSNAEDFAFLTFEVRGMDLLASVAVGLVLTVLASMSAALAATRVSPLEAMRPREDAVIGTRAGTVRLVFGSVLLLAGLAGLVYGTWQADLVVAVAGGALSFVGVLLLGVLFVPAVVSLVGRLARPAGVPGRMARLNAIRNPGRTASTATALLIGTTLVAMMLTGGRTAQQELDTITATEFPVDLQVELATSGPDAGPAAGQSAGQTAGQSAVHSVEEAERSRDAVAAVDGVDAAALLLPAGSYEDGTDSEATVYAADPTELEAVVAGMPVTEGTARLGEAGTVLVPNTVESGTITVTGPTGSVELDTVVSASSSLRPVMTLADAEEIGLGEASGGTAGEGAGDAGSVSGAAAAAPYVWVAASEGITMDGMQQLNTEIAQAAGVTQDLVSGDLAMRLLLSVIIDGMLMVVTALLAVSVLIALIGVANTLSLSAIERSRENSLLRALGLTRRGLRGMLALEAVLISGVAALIGCVLGTFYGGMGAQTVFGPLAADLGRAVIWPAVPWWELAVILAVSLLAGLLASVAPARRATRLAPVQGLALA